MQYLPLSSATTACFIILMLLSVEDVNCSRWLIEKLKRFNILKKAEPVIVSEQRRRDCDWCVWASCTPSVTGVSTEDFDAAVVIKRIVTAIGYGINLNKPYLIKLLTSRSELQRQAIEREYKIQFNVDLSDSLGSLTFSRLNMVLKSLSTPLQKYFAKELRKAILKKDRFTMIEIWTTLPGCFILEINKYYGEMYGEGSVEDDIHNTLRDNFSKSDYIDILLHLAKGERDGSIIVNEIEAKKDASDLVNVIVKDIWNPKMLKFREVFTKRSIPQLKKIIGFYEEFRKKDKQFDSLEVDIENGLESVREIYKYMVKIVKNQHMHFAIKLEELLNIYHEEKDTENLEQILLIVRGRCDIDLGDIKNAYQKKYSMSLYNKMTRKFVRSYRQTLLELIRT